MGYKSHFLLLEGAAILSCFFTQQCILRMFCIVTKFMLVKFVELVGILVQNPCKNSAKGHKLELGTTV